MSETIKEHFYLYAISSPYFLSLSLFKLGCTGNPRARLGTYLTGCPPGQEPSCNMNFYGLWEVRARNKDELFDREDRLHDHFLAFRLMRECPGDSEWFNFRSVNEPREHDLRDSRAIESIHAYITAQPWFIRRMPIEDIARIPANHFLRRYIHRNFAIIRNDSEHIDTLNAMQMPIIAKIRAFIADPDHMAGYLIAPCGSGKTVMVAEGIRGTLRDVSCDARYIVICVPNEQIQTQWATTLITRGIYSADDIYFIGHHGTTDPEEIKTIFSDVTPGSSRSLIITTYKSSHLLLSVIEHINLIVLDEAHHLAGIVAEDNKGEGITRRFMSYAADHNIKRLSLTFTPRIVRYGAPMDDHKDDHKDETSRIASTSGAARIEYLSMDDENTFGTSIDNINLRDMIGRGLLPDYYIWVLNDTDHRGKGLLGRAECILDAWNATKRVRNSFDVTYELNHLIIFARTKQEASSYVAFFRERAPATVVLHATSGQPIGPILDKFRESPRAIIINCFVLGEGVDIPCADSVVITYSKQSRGQITQMLLRAGRWYVGKGLFHILVPVIEPDEDMSAFEEVLASLAACDSVIRDEIVAAKPIAKLGPDEVDEVSSSDTNPVPGESTGHILLESFESSDLLRIHEHISTVRRVILTRATIREILAECSRRGIDTSIGYANLRRDEMPELPEDPRLCAMRSVSISTRQTWYDFFHPTNSRAIRIRAEDFARDVLVPNNIHSSEQYDAWYHTLSIGHATPSLQYIADGYFGPEYTGFMDIAQLGIQIVPKRR